MEPSLRIVPASVPKSASVKDTTNSFGLHDTLQYGPRSLAAEVKSESTIATLCHQWPETQSNLQLKLARDVFGMHAPMRRLMERKIVAYTPPMYGPQANLHLDILMGRDEVIEPSDVFLGMETGLSLDIHNEMEKKIRKDSVI